MKVTLYTDPGCPFGFNAQRQELQLMWHYGHAAETERRMIVLSERSSSFEEAGLTQERLARGSEELAQRYGCRWAPSRCPASRRRSTPAAPTSAPGCTRPIAP